MQGARAQRQSLAIGFTLVELAVVLAIVGLLLGSLMYTLSAQTEQRNFEETRRRLEQARELVLAYAIVNGQLPCPARSNSAGAEVRDAASRRCWDGAVEDYYGGALAGGVTGGFLPAATIGYTQIDSGGFAVDAWQNRIRYAVAKSIAAGTCAGAFTNPHWVNAMNLRNNGMACQPGDLLICKSATGITPSACGGTANQIMTQGLIVAIVFSTGKNGAISGGSGADEAANLDGAGNANPVFVFHTPTPADFANGEFDDQFTWITVGELYGKMIAAGIVP
ncbi:MAG TPA: type II secretion system protein [Burkholderiales bacterium]|nr:type II secretion system protein [Burkholderiales bacterium]